MLATTIEYIPGVNIKPLGIVIGSHTEAINFFKDAIIKFKDTIGGSSGTFSKAVDTCTRKAFERMMQHAKEMGANAVVGVRIVVNTLQTDKGKMAQATVYGTAVMISSEYKDNFRTPHEEKPYRPTPPTPGDEIDSIIDKILGDED